MNSQKIFISDFLGCWIWINYILHLLQQRSFSCSCHHRLVLHLECKFQYCQLEQNVLLFHRVPLHMWTTSSALASQVVSSLSCQPEHRANFITFRIINNLLKWEWDDWKEVWIEVISWNKRIKPCFISSVETVSYELF